MALRACFASCSLPAATICRTSARPGGGCGADAEPAAWACIQNPSRKTPIIFPQYTEPFHRAGAGTAEGKRRGSSLNRVRHSMNTNLSRTWQLLLTAAILCAGARADAIFNFDSDTDGTSTTFTDTNNGISATFSSSADPGGFVIYPSVFETLTGNVLGDPGPVSVSKT